MEKNINEKELQQFVEENINLVPKNQMKKFNGMSLEGKVSRIKFYQDMIKLKEDAKIKNSIPNKVKDLFELKHGTVEDAKAVMKFCEDFISSYRDKQIADIDAEIAKLQAMKQSLNA